MLNLTPAVVPSPSDGFVGLLRSDANIHYTICVQIQEALGWAVLFIVVVQCNMYCGRAVTVL